MKRWLRWQQIMTNKSRGNRSAGPIQIVSFGLDLAIKSILMQVLMYLDVKMELLQHLSIICK
jgi:hypothetical protein